MTKKFRNLWISELFCAFCGALESEEKVVHNATITAVKKCESLVLKKSLFAPFLESVFVRTQNSFGLWRHDRGEMMGGALERIPQVGVKQGLLPWQRRLSKQYA